MPKGKTTLIGRLFTDINTKEAVENIRNYLIQNVNIPRDKDGYAIRSEEEYAGLNESVKESLRKNITKEEYDYLMSNPEKIVSDIEKMDIFTYGKYFDANAISNYLRTINPDYKSLSVHEQIKREDFTNKLIEKHNKYAIERALSVVAVNSKLPILDRTYQTLLKPHFNKLSILTNERRKNIIISGTPEEKQEMYMEIFNNLASIDLTKIDIMDDQSLLDNYESVAEIMSISVELTKILRDAEKAGLDLRGEEHKPLIEKLAAVKEYGYIARLRTDVLTHPLYSQVDISQIENNYFGFNLIKPDGTEIDAGEDFENHVYPSDADEYSGYASFFNQIAMIQFQKKDNPIFDSKLPAEERLSKFREKFWTSGNEFMPEEPMLKKVNGEWIERDEDGYDDFEDESNLPDIDLKKADKEFVKIATEMGVPLFDEIIDGDDEEIEKNIEIKDSNLEENPEEIKSDKPEFNIADENIKTGNLIEGIPNINQYRTVPKEKEEGPLTRHDALKQKFIDNVRIIQSVIPDFYITDEEIESYITEERIAMHEWAVEYNNFVTEFRSDRSRVAPSMFVRAFYAIYDNSGTPEAEAYNKELFEKINDPSKEGEEFRTKLFVDLANRVRKIDEDKLSYDKGFNEMAKYTMENIDTLEIGIEFQKINQKRVDENGIIASPEDSVNLKNIEDKAVVLGGIGRSVRETMQSNLFLTLPFDKLSYTQFQSLISEMDRLKGYNNDGVKSIDILSLSIYAGFKSERENFAEPENRDIQIGDFTVTTPDLPDLKMQLNKLRKSLVDADHWYNFNNSDKYKNLISALDESLEAMSDIDNNIDKDKSKEIYDSIIKVKKSAEGYTRHVGKKGKNDIQQKRLDIAKDIINNTINATKIPLIFDTMINSHNAEIHAKKQEEIFNRGLNRTEKLRKEVEKLEAIYNKTDVEIQHLNIDKKILNARDELTNQVGRAEVDMDKIRPLLATVMVGNSNREQLNNIPEGDKKLLEIIDKIANSKPFIEATKDFTSEDINLFLEGKGEQELHYKYSDAIMKIEIEARAKANANAITNTKKFDKVKKAFEEKPEITNQVSKDDFNLKL